jgi:cold shock protein
LDQLLDDLGGLDGSILVLPYGGLQQVGERPRSGRSRPGGDKDLVFHSSALQSVSLDELREGQKVSYTEGQGKKGPCAENVKPV